MAEAPTVTSLERLLQHGRGRVPRTHLLSAAWKELWELPGAVSTGTVVASLGTSLEFSIAGLTFEQFRAFFDEALAAAKKVEPICETGNKYSVSKDFQKLNGELLLHEIKHSTAYQALSDVDQGRAEEFFSFMCLNGELRNRNPLHPNPLDSVVIGNLLNFPKHIFGFPFAGYATNGNEALSLVLFAYRTRREGAGGGGAGGVLYVTGAAEEGPPQDLEPCCARLGMPFRVLTAAALASEPAARLSAHAVVLTSLTNPSLERVSERAAAAAAPLHIHVLDHQLRSILASEEPVHLQLPAAVHSMSLEDGFFRCGYQLYRDATLRDLHFDLPYEWQSQYVSPNEGGSGNSTPLFIDFCFILLGWRALRDAARRSPARCAVHLHAMPLPPCHSLAGAAAVRLPTSGDYKGGTLEGGTVEGVMAAAIAMEGLPRTELERNVFQFQRYFVGGAARDVEGVVTGGGTRSINVAIEAVLARARAALPRGAAPKLVTGNPHLAVERAQRRFRFEVVRVQSDGAICLEGLRAHVRDPAVVAVYTQTLSITDGITDPLEQVVEVLDAENQRRKACHRVPITLINDCCLALSVLLHNDGRAGARNLRVLDLTEQGPTPAIVTLDAHKHLGADKGISMAMGSPGTLSRLNGRAIVGGQPSNGELIRALADMLLVGTEGYHRKYEELSAAVEKATERIAAAGMGIVHAHNRAKGSTAFGVEDPSGRVGRILKKKGHAPAPLFRISPSHPSRCQTGFLMSLTPHCLREVRDGVPALEVFVSDLVAANNKVKAQPSSLASLFREDSLAAILISGGNEDTWLFAMLHRPGFLRDVISVIFRRIYSAIMDSGAACSDRHQAPLRSVVLRAVGANALLLVVLAWVRRRRLTRRPRLAA